MSQQGKGTKKSIQYDEDDDGNGSDDGYAKKMPAKLDDQKKPAAESECWIYWTHPMMRKIPMVAWQRPKPSQRYMPKPDRQTVRNPMTRRATVP